MENIIIKFFNLKPSDIENIEIMSAGDNTFATITLTARPTPCPICGTPSRLIHDYYERKLNHAVLAENKLTVIYRRRRYYCKVCQRSFAEKNPFALPGKRVSSATVLRVMKLLKIDSMTFSAVAELTGLSVTTVTRIFDEHAGVCRSPLPVCICIDEVYVSKYMQQEYACVLLDFDTGDIYDLIDSRKKASLSEYFASLSHESRKHVKYISMDMWDNYREIAKLYFPDAVICVDSFHVIKNIGYAFDKVRIRVMKSFEYNSEEYRLLKRFHWLLKKSHRHVNPDEVVDLKRYYNITGSRHIRCENLINRLISTDPELELAYTLKSTYEEINDTATYDNADILIDNILDDIRVFGIPEFKPISKTIRKWKQEIINNFIIYNGRRISNGPVESMNSRIQKVKRNANGCQNFIRFRKRCLYTLNGSSSVKF